MAGNTAAKETALNGYLKSCGDRAACPFRTMSVAEARTWLLRLAKRTDKQPLVTPSGAVVSQSMLYDAIYNLLIKQRTWPDLDEVMNGLLSGDAEGARQAAGGGPTDPPVSIENAAPLCLDLPDRRGARTIMADARRSEVRHPFFARPTMAGANTVCSRWPVASVSRPHTVRAAGAPVILVVGITQDTAGPYRWSTALASQLERGRLVTLVGYGHGAATVSGCVRGIEARYLVDGVVPAVGTVCPAE